VSDTGVWVVAVAAFALGLAVSALIGRRPRFRKVETPDDLLPHYRGMYREGRWE
jgi:hypothetical protein